MENKSLKVKLWDGLKVTTADGVQELREGGMRALWDLFGWDIDTNPDANACADIITRELFCFGFIDLTRLNHGKKLFVEIIPVKEF